jgi:hypothetical protein
MRTHRHRFQEDERPAIELTPRAAWSTVGPIIGSASRRFQIPHPPVSGSRKEATCELDALLP